MMYSASDSLTALSRISLRMGSSFFSKVPLSNIERSRFLVSLNVSGTNTGRPLFDGEQFNIHCPFANSLERSIERTVTFCAKIGSEPEELEEVDYVSNGGHGLICPARSSPPGKGTSISFRSTSMKWNGRV